MPLYTRVGSLIRTLIEQDLRRRRIERRLGDFLVETIERNRGMQELSGTRAVALPTRVFEGESWRRLSCRLYIEKKMHPPCCSSTYQGKGVAKGR
jgi:hypothetical protein